MKTAKRFDCVEMKWEIQQRLDREFEGLSAQEVRAEAERRIEADPILGPFVKGLRDATPSPESPAEVTGRQ